MLGLSKDEEEEDDGDENDDGGDDDNKEAETAPSLAWRMSGTCIRRVIIVIGRPRDRPKYKIGTALPVKSISGRALQAMTV